MSSVRAFFLSSFLAAGLVGLAGCSPSHYGYEDEARYEAAPSKVKKGPRAARYASAKRVRTSTRPATAKPSITRTAATKPQPAQAEDTATPKPALARATVAKSPATPEAAAPAATAAATTPPSETKSAEKPADEAARKTAKKQIEDGYRLMRAGFVKKARERFELAMSANAAEASLGVGRSMDPSYLKSVAFPDVVPDADQASRLYRRAILLGNTEAKTDLERLEKALAAAAPAAETPPAKPE